MTKPDPPEGESHPEPSGERPPDPDTETAKSPRRGRIRIDIAIVVAVIGLLGTVGAAVIGLAKPQSPGPAPVPTPSMSADPADAACGPNPYERTYIFNETSLSREPENWIQTGDPRAVYERDGRLHLDSYLGDLGAPSTSEGQAQRQPPDVPICEADFTLTVDGTSDTHDGAQFIVKDSEGRTQRVAFGPYNGAGEFEYWICRQPRCDESKYSSFDHPPETFIALGQPILIKFIADRNRISFYADDKFVTSVPSNGLLTGLKFYIYAGDQKSWQTSVDDVHVKNPRQ